MSSDRGTELAPWPVGPCLLQLQDGVVLKTLQLPRGNDEDIGSLICTQLRPRAEFADGLKAKPISARANYRSTRGRTAAIASLCRGMVKSVKGLACLVDKAWMLSIRINYY